MPLRPSPAASEYLSRRDLLAGAAFSACAVGLPGAAVAAAGAPVSQREVTCRTVAADGVDVFYREAGRVGAPVLLLLHGFPNSSHYFRHLMPRLADKFHMIAPDIPLFGFTTVPQSRQYQYSFASFAETLGAFVDALGLKRYAMYVFDYGAPIGFRHALKFPERVTAYISQNGNAYEEGLGEAFWRPVREYWKQRKPEQREFLRTRHTLDGVRAAYLLGAPNPLTVEPESYWLDAALMARPGNIEFQLDLKLDYETNVALYPQFQAYFRQRKPPVLAIWGKHDPAFIPPGAEGYRRDIPDATVKLLDAGHFALETEVDTIAAAIREFSPRIPA
jgi:pimeloyl-ACP methyl ester carboxylesterase